MKKTGKVLLAVLIVACCAESGAETFPIWPDGKAPFPVENAPAAERLTPTRDDTVRITDVDTPTLTLCAVRDADPETPLPAVVVCPGGGLSVLAWNKEGTEIANWLQRQEIHAFILKYRVPGRPDAARADLQRAVSYVRANAVRFNVNPRQIGAIGFSAGANIAAFAATHHAKRIYEKVDDIDGISCRPDFTMLVYPAWLMKGGDGLRTAKTPTLELDVENFPVDSSTPPAFIVQSCDDKCRPETALSYTGALTKAGVPVELHIMPNGGHGYGARRMNRSTDVWPVLAESWLDSLLAN